MTYINHTVRGVPYPKHKTRGDKEAPKVWSEQVEAQTKELPRVKDACIAKFTFFLPPNKFPTDVPYGPDLDNLLKRFMDALNETIFADAQGKDSCIISLHVMKTKVASDDEAGVHLEILPVSLATANDPAGEGA